MKLHLHQLAGALPLLLVIHSSAAVLYVDLNCPTPVPPYTNWVTAATNIQDAIDAAADGETVLVAAGIYSPGAEIVVDANLVVQSANGPAVTVVNGARATRGFVLVSGAYCTLRGFTITNGAAAGDRGGGVWF